MHAIIEILHELHIIDSTVGRVLSLLVVAAALVLLVRAILRNIRPLLAVSRGIDAVNTRLGRWLSWLIVAAVLISTINAIIRKIFDASSNSWLELQWVLFGAVFLLCAPWTLILNEHIRIDIVNQLLPRTVRNVIDLVGHVLFLMPMAVILTYTSINFFSRSYLGNEQSFSAGGLPQWPAKFLVLLGFFVLTVQAVSEIIKRLAVITGDLDDPHGGGGHHASAEAEAERLLAVAQAEAERR